MTRFICSVPKFYFDFVLLPSRQTEKKPTLTKTKQKENDKPKREEMLKFKRTLASTRVSYQDSICRFHPPQVSNTRITHPDLFFWSNHWRRSCSTILLKGFIEQQLKLLPILLLFPYRVSTLFATFVSWYFLRVLSIKSE